MLPTEGGNPSHRHSIALCDFRQNQLAFQADRRAAERVLRGERECLAGIDHRGNGDAADGVGHSWWKRTQQPQTSALQVIRCVQNVNGLAVSGSRRDQRSQSREDSRGDNSALDGPAGQNQRFN